MFRLLLPLLLILSTSCTMMQKAEEALTDVGVAVKRIDAMVKTGQKTLTDIKTEGSKLAATYRDAKLEADTDKDGTTSLEEWTKWLAGPGALGLIALFRRLTKSTREKETEREERKKADADTAMRLALLERSSPPGS